MSLVNEKGQLEDLYQNFIHVNMYARWIESENRRETWSETVHRYMNFMKAHLVNNYNYHPDDEIFNIVGTAIYNQLVMPSMRLMATAGDAMNVDNVCAYNCAFVAIDDFRALDETMYLSMNGCGVGFSVQKKHTEKLPSIPAEITNSEFTITVDDSKKGWAQAFRSLIVCLLKGFEPKWDLSQIRPAGSKLKTFGGRASGPEPLDRLFKFVVSTFRAAVGRKLKPLELHDILCMVGEIVVSGGRRRSALISLSDLDDEEIAKAKTGPNWWEITPWRALSNNSAVYEEVPTKEQFEKEWNFLYESKAGERGIFNLLGSRQHIALSGNRDASKVEGVNPCGEILLRSKQFCNLTEVIVRPDDTEFTLLEKVKIAATIGTWQSTFTNFPYLRPEWKENCDEERLLGVSMTGLFGSPLTITSNSNLRSLLEELRSIARITNNSVADQLGIPRSAAITCIKPSGTISQLTNVSDGIHPWWSPYYIRNVQAIDMEPLTQMLKACGIPHEPSTWKKGTSVFSFPRKAPSSAITRDNLTAIQHLEMWKLYYEHWTDHNPSITVNIRESEWDEVREWVFKNFNLIGGIAFLPYSDHVYSQSPYYPIQEEEYTKRLNELPKNIDWSQLSIYETEDTTKSPSVLACSGGVCDLVEIGAQ